MLPGIGTRIRHAVATLAPGYFALVMASGIISVGLQLRGFRALSLALLAVAALAFVVLLIMTTWRLIRYRPALLEEFTNARRGFGFFTIVAGANVLGVRLGIAGYPEITAVLLAVGATLWVLLGYVVPWTVVIGRGRKPLIRAANGTWFIWVVASQSVATAAATLQPAASAGRHGLALLAVVSWSVGACLYLAIAFLVILRLVTYPLKPADLLPPYWVSMGALAITVLAATRLVEMVDAPTVATARGLMGGLAVVLWGFSSWLYPALVAVGWWRHVHHRVALTYDATLWSIIFPLGMYGVASIYLDDVYQLPLIGAIGGIELWVAFAAWVAVFAAMVVHLWNTVAIGRNHRPHR